MDVFDVLNLIGGLCLFLFGMNLMGQALERRAGGGLRTLLGKMTGRKLAGFATGLCITAVIQSSSATTVMVVGFVNSGLLTLRQAINVIMGANVGTTVTAWLLSLGGISGDALWVRMLKPSSFTPILALIGIILYMFCKSGKKKDTGMIFLGFATLMFGMEAMTGSVAGLRNVPQFQQLFVAFTNPVLGVLAGTVLTAIIQSSSASVGILQALAVTGAVSYGAAIPIIMGQNIGTCVTALISSVGTNKNAKRAALVHLSFNVIGTVVGLVLFCVGRAFLPLPILNEPATMYGIAIAHSCFNILCTALMLPATELLEKLVDWLVPDAKSAEENAQLDERLLATPAVALERCHSVAVEMAGEAVFALKEALSALDQLTPQIAEAVRSRETATDREEDMLSTYLLKLSATQVLGDSESEEVTELLKLVGDFERIADHAVNILESAEELHDKKLEFSEAAKKELSVLRNAVTEVLDTACEAFENRDVALAMRVEPLEQVIDAMKEQMRTNHIMRLKNGDCGVETGFVLSDLLTNLERVSDHCSNIAGCVIDLRQHNLNLHASLQASRNGSEEYLQTYRNYARKYSLQG